MAYPQFYPFKTRVLNATSTSSNTIMAVPVPARSKFINAYYVTTPLASQTAVGTIDITVNGSTAGTAGGFSGWTGITVTTSTGNTSTNLGTSVSAGVQYLNAGDVLATVASSVVGGGVSFVLQEF